MNNDPLSFLVLALAPFAPVPESGYRPRLTLADTDNIDAAIKEVAPGFYIPLPSELCPAAGIDVRISRLADFHPDELLKTDPYLRRLQEAAAAIRNGLAQGVGASAIYDRLQAFPGLPVRIERPAGPAAPAPAASNSAIDDLLSMVSAPAAAAVAPSVSAAKPEQWAEELEATLSSILFRVVADESFRRAEAAWRGLDLLCRQAGEGKVSLALCPTSEAVLGDTIEALKEGMPQSPALVVADFAFDNTTRSFDLLRALADFGETMLCPVITGIGARFFGLKGWDDIDKLPFLPHLLDNAAYAKWRKLRKESSADWLMAVVNRLPSRPAFGRKNPAAIDFNEGEQPWLGEAWAPAALMAGRVAGSGWPTRFDDRRSRLSGMAAAAGEAGPRFCEAALSEERIRQLAEIGISSTAAEGGEAAVEVAVTSAGNPMNYQLALSRVVGLILRLRAKGGGSTDEIGGAVRSALSRLWQAAGVILPESAEIAAFEDDVRGGIAVRVALTPGKEILPSPQLIELTLNW